MFCITENVRSDLIKNEKMENGKQNDFPFVFFVLLFDIYYFSLIFGGIKEVFFRLVFISVDVYGRNNGKMVKSAIVFLMPGYQIGKPTKQPARQAKSPQGSLWYYFYFIHFNFFVLFF